MKSQITHNANAVAVQPQTTFHKEDRTKKQRSTTLKLAVFFAMVITMALSAVAQDTVVSGTDQAFRTLSRSLLRHGIQPITR